MARVKRGVTKHARHKKVYLQQRVLEEDKKYLQSSYARVEKICNMLTETEEKKKRTEKTLDN